VELLSIYVDLTLSSPSRRVHKNPTVKYLHHLVIDCQLAEHSFKGIVSRDFVVSFLVSFDRSEVPTHTERIYLLFIFRFRVEFFDFRFSA
jgi:hypothetical protein